MTEPSGQTAHQVAARFRAVLFAQGDVSVWLPTIVRLLGTPGLESIVLATTSAAQARVFVPDDERLTVVESGSFADVLIEQAHGGSHALLVMTSPALPPVDGIGPALDMLEADARVASVSFLCNAAGHLSFPHRNGPTPYSMEGYDESSLSRRLRGVGPEVLPVPIAATAGPATLLSRDCVVVTGGPDRTFEHQPEVAIAEMALRAARRGMRSVLDASTFIARPWELAPWGVEPLTDEGTRHELEIRHHFFPRLYDADRADDAAPISLAMNTARAKAQGLRILVDGSCLGPIENGTQVQTLALVEALVRREDVQWVGVGVPGGVPRYAERILSHPKTRTILSSSLQFEDAPQADIVHRPFQPDKTLPWDRWRSLGGRVVVTIQDLIAYGIGAYHLDSNQWLSYRRALADAVHRADGTIVISHDVADQLRQERMPVESQRLFVIENGTDHLRGDEPDTFPSELISRGWAATQFLVVLGANYSHKNRDLAIEVWKKLRERGHAIALVFAGVAVAQGSSRVLEAAKGSSLDGVVSLPDVTSEERNWLLRHASLCLYPTAAEGFGLVPFEAARFGTATVHTRFGPLAEVLPDAPVVARSWDPEELAACADRLLADPQLRKEQIDAALKSGDRYTWDLTAEGLVTAYRRLLCEPAR